MPDEFGVSLTCPSHLYISGKFKKKKKRWKGKGSQKKKKKEEKKKEKKKKKKCGKGKRKGRLFTSSTDERLRSSWIGIETG